MLTISQFTKPRESARCECGKRQTDRIRSVETLQGVRALNLKVFSNLEVLNPSGFLCFFFYLFSRIMHVVLFFLLSQVQSGSKVLGVY